MDDVVDRNLVPGTESRAARAPGWRNISDAERWLSLGAGAALILYGLTRRRAGWILAGFGAMLLHRGTSGHCHTYAALGISTAGSDTRRALRGPRGTIVEERIVVNRPVSEVYRFWRELENLPRFMTHLESVEQLTGTLSRWRAKGPAGTHVEWNAEIINEVPNQVIGWRSIEGSDVVSAGSVNFEDRNGATRLRIRLQYSPPGGRVGDAVARLFGKDAATEIRHDLKRFKDVIESR